MTATTKEPVIICVYGATGTGKSSFINDATGASLPVGHSPESCTDQVMMAPRFTLDGREVWLVDTPGFDDSSLSDSQVLKMIGDFMVQMSDTRQLISGIIYMHRITDIRVGGVAQKNFRVLRELCGPNAMKNLIICTNMWTEHPDPAWETREKELIETPKYFQPAVAKGARVTRYVRSRNAERTVERAHDIIRMCLKNVPVVTQYQEEISQGATIANTSAGRVANEEIQRLMALHKSEITQLVQCHKEAIRKKDEETRQEIEEERARLDETLAILRENIRQLNRSLRDKQEMRAESSREYKKNQQKQEENIKKLEEKIKGLEERLKRETDPREAEELRREISEISSKLMESMVSMWESIYSSFARLKFW